MKPEYIFAAAVLMLLALAFLCIIALFLRARKQERRVNELQNRLDAASAPGSVAAAPDAFHYLAIGNSITLHGKCHYWWNEVGMAASVKEKDYFHIVKSHLESVHGNVSANAYNFAVWEITAHDRTQTIGAIKDHLSPALDLITLQLSENVSDVTTFPEDLCELIAHLKETCPKAKIILVDDFWSEEKSEMKRAVAEKLSVSFASLADIRGKDEYKCPIGTTVYGDNGIAYAVDHDGVAAHPGDEGMKAIAERIIKML